MSNKKEERILWRSLILISIGLATIFFITRLVNATIGLIAFYIGFTLTLLGLADICIIMWRNRTVRNKIVNYHHKRMSNANKGIVWIWAVCLAGICVYTIAFYVLLYPTLQLLDIVEGLVTWDANASFTLNLTRTVLNWHPILFIVGLLIWAYVNSQRREDVTYPTY